MAALEAAALNGTLFQPQDPPSPSRSTSSSTPDTDDELGSDLSDRDGGETLDTHADGNEPQTGPKGVISDKNAHVRHERQERKRAFRETREKQTRHALVGLTLDEEEALKSNEQARLLVGEGKEREEDEKFKERWRTERRDQLESERKGLNMKKGLREIGSEGFLRAVERPGWVIVLIYEPGIPRCSALLASLLQMSLADPPLPIGMYRARATSLSFSLLPTQGRGDDQDDAKADPDVLPTLLAYKDGELEKTWIRVDWDVKEDGLEGLLRREDLIRSGILPSRRSLKSADGGPESDDED